MVFALIRQVQMLQIGMGAPFLQDWVDGDEPGPTRDWAYPVRDSDGATQCWEYQSIWLQTPETQQYGCRGQFAGSTFRPTRPTPSGRSVCGTRAWDSGQLVHGC